MTNQRYIIGIDLGNSNSVFTINYKDNDRSGTFVYSAITGLRVQEK